MSKRKVAGARMEGYEGPYFPEALDSFHDMLYAEGTRGLNGQELRVTFQDHTQLLEVEQYSTSDGYGWFWCLTFGVRDARVRIALPWSQDWEMADGQQSDRHSAVYVQGKMNPGELNGFIATLNSHLSQRLKEMTGIS